MPATSPSTDSALPRDIRLVVADMDGTLLDEAGTIPASFWPVLRRLTGHGIVFAPASGRQHPALSELFSAAGPEVALIAENGAHVVRDGEVVACSTIDPETASTTVASVRDLSRRFDLGLVWSGRHSAYVERGDEPFVREVGRFYTSLTVLDDLARAPENPLKFAVFDFAGGSAGSREALTRGLAPLQVVMSNEHWMDVMDPAVNKGVALQALQSALGVSPEQTVVFGDYLNDLEMFPQATHSFAMANAHEAVTRSARHRAPSNRDHGVITTLELLLEGMARGGESRRP